jgi:hypothetical protein
MSRTTGEKIKLLNKTGQQINPATEETLQSIETNQENHICTDNTTIIPLGPNAVFTGAWQDCLQYQEVNVSISTDKNSATDGLEIQWSDNGTDIADKDNFTVYANSGTNYTPNPAFRYVRLKYTNGSQAQGSFHLMTILRRGATGGSFHRITDTLKDDSDGRLNLSVLKLRTAANNYVSGSATNSGNFKVSLEEYETGANPIRTNLEGGGSVTIGTTAVELTFTGTTRNIILTANQSNTGIIYIGKSTVTNLGANALTFLMPGESLSLDYNDATNALYAVSGTAGQSLFKGTLL